MLDSLLDKSIYFSFDRTGFVRHAACFDDIDELLFKNMNVVITGGTSGIGRSMVDSLMKNNSNVIFTGRALKDEHNKHSFRHLDMCDHLKIIEFAESLPPLDGIVLNAGGMPELYREFYGFEAQFSSQLLGHYILIRKLMDLEKLKKGSNVIWMSSGGMYMVKYNSRLIKNSEDCYDKVAFYANVKRAQIIVNDFLAKEFSDQEINFSVMHPGWVNTTGVQESIPGFFKFTEKRLRSPEQGADTALWLLTRKKIDNGEFWFDRKKQKKIVFPWTTNSSVERSELFNLCESHYQSILHSQN